MIDSEMGTRHRAAIGISEETDAIVVIVSEESSKVSVAENGKFVRRNLKESTLEKYLNSKMFISSND
jgi:diadenylate cyclase